MKSLIKRELLHVRWVWVIMLLSLVIPLLGFLNSISYYANNPYHSHLVSTRDFFEFGGDVFLWFVLPLFIIVQFYYERKQGTYELLAAMPYTRNQRLQAKYTAGVLSIMSAYLISLLLFILITFSGNPIDGDMSYVWYWLVLAIGSALLQYSFYFMIGTIVGHGILSGIVGFISIYVPAFLTLSVAAGIDTLTSNGLGEQLAKNTIYLIPVYFPFVNVFYSSHNYIEVGTVFAHANVYVLLSVLCLVLAHLFWNRSQQEYTGNLFLFSWMEKVFRVGFTLCFFALAFDITMMSIDGWLLPVFAILSVASIPFGWFISNKILQFTGHQIRIKQSGSLHDEIV